MDESGGGGEMATGTGGPEAGGDPSGGGPSGSVSWPSAAPGTGPVPVPPPPATVGGTPPVAPATAPVPPAARVPWPRPGEPSATGPVVTPPPGPHPDSRPAGGRAGWVVVAVVAALIGAAVGGGVVAAFSHRTATTTVDEIAAGPALLNGTTDIEAVIAKLLPATVSIEATSVTPQSTDAFGDTTGGQEEEDQGTGVIVTSTGEVVTNNHVIAGATTITVTLYGKTTSLPATLVDTDPTDDVALLQITGASGLPTISYGDSDHVQVGDAVVAIGNALGLSDGTPTVTQGIISAKGRTVTAGDEGTGSSETLTNMFQTDAAINPGNSGGPLVDSSGKVIGMNTAVASTTDGTSQAQNIGFAIPANSITALLPGLRDHSIGGAAQQGPGYLGVSLETMTPGLQSAYDFVPSQGAVVLQVENGSPAAVAGLEEGDVIVSLDGKPIASADQLAADLQADHPGQSVRIGIYRGEAQLTVTATLASGSSSSGGS